MSNDLGVKRLKIGKRTVAAWFKPADIIVWSTGEVQWGDNIVNDAEIMSAMLHHFENTVRKEVRDDIKRALGLNET